MRLEVTLRHKRTGEEKVVRGVRALPYLIHFIVSGEFRDFKMKLTKKR